MSEPTCDCCGASGGPLFAVCRACQISGREGRFLRVVAHRARLELYCGYCGRLLSVYAVERIENPPAAFPDGLISEDLLATDGAALRLAREAMSRAAVCDEIGGQLQESDKSASARLAGCALALREKARPFLRRGRGRRVEDG